MKYKVEFQQRQLEVEIHGEPPHYELVVDGHRTRADTACLGDESLLSLLLDNDSYLAHVVPAERNGVFEVSIAGKFARVQVLDELSSMAQALHAEQAAGRFVLKSPMPGLVVEIRVQPGDRVEAGSPLVIMEAMKMQNELASESAGTVTAVHAKVNDAVESGTELVVVESDTSS
ncbi:MAG: acetyl-CoA carboxylase biotin carboxyl carrier protein subunit [Candidatus Latescibacterota bacterium]|nr:MAG: acetyl-CoA carboxylase biotin carboxyl carrier protein subunit [Candidatus Latescibacterota bacterium]